MKALQCVLRRGWGKTAVAVLLLTGVSWLPLGQQSSFAGQASSPVTQIELLQWLVHLRGADASLPAAASTSDYVQWARSQGIEPHGGWNAGAVLTRADFAQTLAQLFGLNSQSLDAGSILEKEGVVLPADQTVSRATLVTVVDQFGFQSRTALTAQAATTKTKGNNGVGNGLDPQPPGNPKVNDGPGTGPGNPGNKPPQP
jgi:hypothetical protein